MESARQSSPVSSTISTRVLSAVPNAVSTYPSYCSQTRTHPSANASKTSRGSVRRASIPAALSSSIVRIGSRSGMLVTTPIPSMKIMAADGNAMPVRRGSMNICVAP